MRRRVRLSLVWTTLESAGLSGLSLLTLFVLARLVSTDEFGIAALALSIVQILNMAAENLFQDAVVQRRTLSDDDLATAFWSALAAGLATAAACWAMAPLLAAWLDKPLLAPVLSWLALGLVANASAAVIVAKLRRGLDFKAVALRSLAGRLAGSAGGIGLALLGYGVWGLVAQQLAASLIGALIVWAGGHYRPRLVWSRRAFRELIGFSGPQSLGNLLFVGSTRTASILVGVFHGTAGLGLLAMGGRMADAVRDILVQAINPLTLPLFSRQQGDRAALLQRYRLATSFTCLATMPVFALLLAAAPDLFRLALGLRWDAAVLPFQLLVAALLLQFARLHSVTLLNAVGRPDASLLLAAVDFAAMIALMLAIGRSDLGLAAAAIGGRQLVTAPLSLLLVRRHLGFGLAAQLGPALVPLAAALAAAAAAAGLRSLLPGTWPAVAVVPLLGGVILAVYLPSVALFDRPGLAALTGFLRGRS